MDQDALYRDIVERSPDAIWVCDLEGHTIYANPAMCALYGASVEEMGDVTVYDSLDSVGRAQFAAHLEAVRRGETNAQDVDVLFWRRDGSSLWVVVSERELRDADGRVVGFVHRISDYSGRRRALDELEESRTQLAEAHRIARLGSWWWDVEADEITASPELCALYGLEPGGYPSTYAGVLEIVHPQDRAGVDAAVSEARRRAGEFVFVARIRGASGWVWTRGRGVSTADDEGRVIAMSGTHQDITETKLAELALEDQVRQNALMQAVAVAANEARTLAEVLGRARHLVLLHDDWERARGFVPDESGETMTPLYINDEDRRADEETAEESAMELELAQRAFRERRAVWSDSRLTIAFPIYYDERVYAVITLTSAPPLYRFDMIQSMVEQVAVELGRVAEREQAQRQLAAARDAAMEASRQKSEFLATMSHEIRTPLNGVIGLNDLLMRTDLDPDQRRYASGVQLASRSLLAIINDILDFSKIEAGKLQLERLDFEVRAVFDQVASMLGESARAKGLELIVACHPDVPEVLSGDPTRLAQVLTNLGSNAVKFTEAGEVFIRATAEPLPSGAARLHVSVTDTGVGVPAGDVETLFEAFTQADASTTRRFGGTGLGLAISREIVTALGGRIGLRPNPGGGSVFWFTVDLDAPVGARVDAEDEYARATLSGRRLLVVDDNPHNRLILAEQVARWRVDADQVGDADAAEAAVRAARGAGTPYDAVLLDLAMPERDGLDLARALRADPANADLRLLMVSSTVMPEPEVLAGAGILACLTKPALAVELRSALLTHVAGARPQARMGPTPEPIAREAAGARHRALVVEDNPVNQLVAVGLLQALGYESDVAEDGEEAIRLFQSGHHAVVLMDVQMPRMDGYAATRAIRTAETGRRTPIIAMTAAAVEGERERCLAAGMDDFLTKPVDAPSLAATLGRWVEPAQAGVGATPGTSTLRDVLDEDPLLATLALDRLAELRDLDPDSTEYLDRAIGNFVRNTPDTSAAIRKAIADGDAEKLGQVAHKLAGGALNLGVGAAGRTAQQLELLARSGSLDGAAAMAERLDQDLADGRAALLAYQATYAAEV